MHQPRSPRRRNLVLAAAVLLVAMPATAAQLSMTAELASPESALSSLATFVLDTDAHTLSYELAPEVREQRGVNARILGFAPPGWDAKTLVEVPRSGSGVWQYPPVEEENILDGLAYLTVNLGGETVRAQIELVDKPVSQFPNDVATVDMAGTCNSPTISITRVAEHARVDMQPAQVRMIRGASRDSDHNGLRDVDLNVAVRVGGAYVEGLGHIDVEMLGDHNPARVEALQRGSDFPAVMTMTLRKRYITPVGTFVGETEYYRSNPIDRFPPFGSELLPVNASIRLLDEKTGEVAGELTLGPITPLYHVHPSVYPVDDPYLPEKHSSYPAGGDQDDTTGR